MVKRMFLNMHKNKSHREKVWFKKNKDLIEIHSHELNARMDSYIIKQMKG